MAMDDIANVRLKVGSARRWMLAVLRLCEIKDILIERSSFVQDAEGAVPL